MRAAGAPEPERSLDLTAHHQFLARLLHGQFIANGPIRLRHRILHQIQQVAGLLARNGITVFADLGGFDADHRDCPVAPSCLRGKARSGAALAYFCASFFFRAAATAPGTNLSTSPPSAAISRTMLELT